MPRHGSPLITKSLRMLHRIIENGDMRRMSTRPIFQIRPVAMETCAARLTDGTVVFVQVLEEAEADGTCAVLSMHIS